MINYFHIIIIITIAVIIKMTVFTNKKIKETLPKAFVVMIFTIVVVFIGWIIKQPISNLTNASEYGQPLSISLFNWEDNFTKIINTEKEMEIYKSIAEDVKVQYTLKSPKKLYQTPDDLISIVIVYDSKTIGFSVSGSNQIYYNDKFYNSADQDLFSYLSEMLKRNEILEQREII